MKRLCKKDVVKVDAKKPGLTRKGVASLYIVIFATILFGVVTLSFMRIILSEAEQGSDDDLSRSAYDAAIAGVEDAKTAVNRYYQCLNGDTSSVLNKCDDAARKDLFADKCEEGNGIGLARYLYGYTEGEVKIQETNLGSGEAANNNSDQAYTCVIISDTVPDYRGTLTSDTRTKVVPLGVFRGNGTSSGLGSVKKVEFSWYSQLNTGDGTNYRTSSGGVLNDKDLRTVPPTVALTYIKVDSGYTMEDFYRASNNGDYATTVLLPSGSIGASASQNIINRWDRRNASNVDVANTPKEVSCSTASAFMCKVELTELDFDNYDSAFLVVSLPYGDTVTDFAVTLYEDNEGTKPKSLTGVQVSVDSTGRTNDLVRRVEVRLDPADLFFPYPQYALELDGGDGESELKKNFWVTANCWYSRPAEGGSPAVCSNYGEVKS